MEVDIDISREQREQICNNLAVLMVDSYMLYLKTQNFHWNVKGPRFYELHKMFEEQYTALATAIDEIAERITTLGAKAPGSFMEFSELSNIKESKESLSADEMIKVLAIDNEGVAKVAKSGITIASEAGDDPTVDLLTQRAQIHEKTSWMLRSSQA